MISFAQTCPGLTWNSEHDAHWATNLFYNSSTNEEEKVLASPAETLNLLSSALFDESRFRNKGEIALRISSFCNCLLELAHGVNPICSGGQQHELLFLLNHSYLDERNPIVMYTNVSQFVAEAFENYLEGLLAKASPMAKLSLVLAQLKWDGEADAPILSHLKFHNGEKWQQHARDFLEQACKTFGFNPSHPEVKTNLDLFLLEDTINAWTLRFIELPIISTLESIFEPLPIRLQAAAAAQPDEAAKETLVQQAIGLRNTITPDLCIENPQTINNIASVLEALRWLHADEKLTLCMDLEDSEFMHARVALHKELSDYLANVLPNTQPPVLPKAFVNIKAAYTIRKKAYDQSEQLSFIKNYFALFSDAEPHQRAELIQRSKHLTSSLPLTDDKLRTWYEENNQQGVISLSPYELNRILLQATVQTPASWTPMFIQAFDLVAKYLSNPESPEDAFELRQLKKSYPDYFLRNCRLLALVTSSAIAGATKEQCNTLFQSSIASNLLFFSLFDLSDEILSPANKNELWTLLEPHLETLVQDPMMLYFLLELPADKLTTVQKIHLLKRIAPNFPQLMPNGMEEVIPDHVAEEIIFGQKACILTIFGRPIEELDVALRNRIRAETLNAIIQEGQYKGMSAVYHFVQHPEGRDLLRNDAELRKKITPVGLNAMVAQDELHNGTSALYWLAGYPEGLDLLINDVELRKKITPEGLNALKQEGLDKGASALFWFVGTSKGLDIVRNDAEFREKITPEGLNAVVQEGPSKGWSPLLYLASTEEGRDLMINNEEFWRKITPEGLNSLKKEGENIGTSALYWLTGYPETRSVLFNDAELRKKITSEGLNAVIRGGTEEGKSALFWLASQPEGIDLLCNDAELRKKITPEGLNAVVQEGPNKGSSALLCLASTKEGKDLIWNDAELRKKITPEGLNAVMQEGCCRQFAMVRSGFCDLF